MRTNIMIQQFEGMLTEGIWLRLAIEEKISEMQAEWKEITAQNIAMELLEMGNVPGKTTSDELLETCEDHLRQYSDPFDGLGDINADFEVLTESGKHALFTAVTARSKLFKAHAAKLDAYAKAKFGDDVFQ